MVKLEENKIFTENKNIVKAPLPSKAYIPLSQHLGKPCEPLVRVGDYVCTGQIIGKAEAFVSAVVHSSISGKVIAIDDWPHPVLGKYKAVIIESDGLDKQPERHILSQEDILSLPAEEIRRIVFHAGIVGMGGAAFPAQIKLTPPQPVDNLIINGAECEPYVNADNRLMLERASQVISAIALVVKCVGAKNVYIAIENNKPHAIEVFRKELQGSSYKLKVIKSFYPQGGEKQLIKNVLGREIPRGKLPFEVGAAVHNVATLYAIYEAVYLSKPLYERAVTVAGDCLRDPGNFLVRIGTPIKDLVALTGPLKKEPKKIIFGGPMMGVAQYSLDVPVIKSTNGIILFSQTETKSEGASSCIRCSRCVQECPVSLMPCMIALAAEKEKWDLAKTYGCLDCIECGLCSYVCPQKIDLVQTIKYAKARLPK